MRSARAWTCSRLSAGWRRTSTTTRNSALRLRERFQPRAFGDRGPGTGDRKTLSALAPFGKVYGGFALRHGHHEELAAETAHAGRQSPADLTRPGRRAPGIADRHKGRLPRARPGRP